MRVTILTQYYPPEAGAPQARLSALARGLARRGHMVTVLAAKPNYPTGRVFRGYPGAVARETHDGVSILRTLIYPTQRTAVPHRVASYLSFVAASTVAGSVLLARPDYLVVESPPLLLGLAGLWLSRIKGGRLIFNVSDLWPEAAVRLGVLRRGGAAHRLSTALEAACYRRAWLVTGQTAEIIRDIDRRFPGVPTLHLPNGVDPDQFRPERATAEARALVRPEGRCAVVYAGLHGLAQDLDQLLDAAARVAPDGGPDFVFVGDGPARQRLLERARAERMPNVHFLGPKPHDAMPAMLAAADVIVVPLHREQADAVPSKLYEALASGRPVLLIAAGDAARLVADNEAGIVVPPGDLAALVAAVRRLGGDAELRCRLGANARRAAARFDRRRIVDDFVSFLEQGLSAGAHAATLPGPPQPTTLEPPLEGLSHHG